MIQQLMEVNNLHYRKSWEKMLNVMCTSIFAKAQLHIDIAYFVVHDFSAYLVFLVCFNFWDQFDA